MDTVEFIKAFARLTPKQQEVLLNVLPYAAIPQYLPQPAAPSEVSTQRSDLASNFYIERPKIDERCYQELAKPGALIRIKAPCQMGKTSLITRILHQASEYGYATVSLNLQLADTQVFNDLDRFLQWFCTSITRQLGLPNRLGDYWKGIFGSKVACKSYLEGYLLPNLTTPLVLSLDEVDVVCKYPEITADFFALLRACHEDAKYRPIWQKLRLVLVHSTEVFSPMSINQSPFNVGLPIELLEFQPPMVLELAQHYGLSWGIPQVEELMAMVGGYPYLVQLALYAIAHSELTLQQLLETAPTDTGIYSDHLRHHLENLQQHPELAAAVREVVNAPYPVRLDSMLAFKLHSMGLVNLQGNKARPRCNLYRQYFQVKLQGMKLSIYSALSS
ncbi:MAG TPA: hypothetical protein DDZ80_06810 [Cyanobacteria bacterium UBA8803]|nr:hypothetical protein [Cyanobacteria bacterium UBA9273]HBL58232.1 hypothetical protein [Cyanobacteria bacterium UBA8803]